MSQAEFEVKEDLNATNKTVKVTANSKSRQISEPQADQNHQENPKEDYD